MVLTKTIRLPGDVLPAKIGNATRGADQPVLGVEVAGELGEGTEPSIAFDVISAVQEGLGCCQEGLDGGERTLLVLVGAVVLASPLGDPDRLSGELRVEALDGADEVVGVHAIVVEAQEVNLANGYILNEGR